jgi:hypothetical protein
VTTSNAVKKEKEKKEKKEVVPAEEWINPTAKGEKKGAFRRTEATLSPLTGLRCRCVRRPSYNRL